MIFLLNNWRLVATLAAIVFLSATAGFYKWQATRWENKYETFRIEVRAAGLAAEIRAKEIEAKNKKAKEVADAEHKTAVSDLRATLAKLRRPRSGGGSMSPAPANSKCPTGQTCFDTAEYQRAIGEFDSEARRLADEGSEIAIDLDTAKKWASDTMTGQQPR